MKPVLMVYATREGHTQSVAQRMSASLMRRGVLVELANAAHLSADFDLAGCYSAVIVAASVHVGRHEPEMVSFVKRHRADLQRLPTAFLSVSLSQAAAQLPASSQDQKDQAASRVDVALAKFREETGWTPPRTLSVAGALPYLRFKRPLRFVMRSIARASGLPVDTSRDYEWTDWANLDRFADAFAEQLRPSGGSIVADASVPVSKAEAAAPGSRSSP